ncbi:MAG TPA: lamin tail domain-containing protein, partial [Methylomirabilota bacterium]|nr:lamin tail domain-containing protein [Methylomirabilota bacterium]
TNAAGAHEPWIELYNGGSNAVSLNGLFLTSNFTNLTQWAFPTGVVMNPGTFRVLFADGQTNLTTNELHTNFRLPAGAGSVALSRMFNGQAQIIDYVNYVAGLDHSYGSFPDGQPFARQEFFYVTAGTTNNGTLPPVIVSINEWMADNVGAPPDPADGNYEDWFEIYNPGSNAVSLGGYFLTDALTNKFKFEIPAGYFIPAGGYLLVWADSESAQNDLGGADLHVNFNLSKSGETIALFTPDGLQVDAVTFGPQTSDVAMGRFPDGGVSTYFLTNYTPRAANVLPQSNFAPALTPIGNKSVFEGHLLSFTASATDGNPGQQLTWSIDPGAPAGAQVDSSNGVFHWLPGEPDGGSNYSITIRVTDNGAPPMKDTRTFTVSVLKTNNVPVLNVPGDSVVGEGSLLTFMATATDQDLPGQQITFSLDPANSPTGAAINATNGVFTWEPAEAQGPGAYTIIVRVTDSGTPPLSNSAPVAIIVNEVNTAPVLAPITNRTVTLGETVSFNAYAIDTDLPEQDLILTFVGGGAPAGATLNPTNGFFSWIANSVGTNTLSIRVSDSGSPELNDTQTFDLVVTMQFQITTIAVSNNVVALNWAAISGRRYDVEYKNSLGDAAWTPLATNITAGTNSASVTDPIDTNTHRIYRIVLQP